MSDPFFCPNCGAEVPQGALACPACGSDHETGWSEEARYQDLGFFVWDEAEPADSPPRSFLPNQHLLAVLSLLTIAAFLAYLIPGGIYLAPVVLLGGGLAYYLARVRPRPHDPVQERLYRQLLAKARGDSDLVERLVAYERQRNPDAGRSRLLQNAIDRWERDL
jgi:hypothetical protein